MAQKVVFLTTTGSGTYTIPNDFGSLVSVEAIGGGGAGSNASTGGAPGGGGGAYAKSTTVTGLAAGGIAYYNVGAGGTTGGNGSVTWFNAASNAAPTLASQGVKADFGLGGGNGGQAANCVGDLSYNGGNGGSATSKSGGGGGGAAGPGGAGGMGGSGNPTSSGQAGGGGGGASLTHAGYNGGDATVSGTGGNGGDNTGGGAAGAPGSPGTAGTGGGGGGGNNTKEGGNGATGTTSFTQTSDSSTAGSGGGGGGGVGNTGGGSGGLYGGGGGGWGTASALSYPGAQGIIVFTYTPATKTVFLTTTGSTQTYKIPSDFVSFISVEAIGAGGAGNSATINGTGRGYGGGGGAYAISTAVTGLTAGQTCYYSVGAGAINAAGGDSWFNTSNAAPSSGTTGVLAKGGGVGTRTTGSGAGGAAASCVPTTGAYSGGTSTAGSLSSAGGGGGGGGAGGPNGAGAGGAGPNNNGGTGGGGANGGSVGSATTGSNGGAGGNGFGGTGGGAGGNGVGVAGTDGTAGTGGGGGGGYDKASGGAGGTGSYWTSSTGATAGPGGGGGGAGDAVSNSGVGGLYGGGGGACGGSNSTYVGAAGAQGIVVFTYSYNAALYVQKTVFITTTGTGTYRVPNDFSSFVSVEAIGGGGGGSNGASLNSIGGGGGGGGAYAKSTSVTNLSAGQTCYYSVGQGGNGGSQGGGNDSWFNVVSNAAPTLTSQGVLAKAGSSSNSSSQGQAGGDSTSCVGDTKYSGGTGGSAQAAAGAGGGGAAGPGGIGGNGGNAVGNISTPSGGSGGGGGGGASLTHAGYNGASATSKTSPGNGGNGGDNTGGGLAVTQSNGNPGTAGTGGGGGGSGGGLSGGNGGTGSYWTQTSNSATAGSGGGGGGGGGNGAGGLYGGGGGGGTSGFSGANGANGIIVFTYIAYLGQSYPSPKPPSNFQKDDPVYGKVDLDDTYVTDAWLLEKYAGNNLFSWGLGSNGGIGDNTTADKSSPVQIGRLSTWKQVATAGGAAGTFTVALKTDGTLWGFGNNTFGQLGLGNTTALSSPVQVGTLTNWKQVSAARSYTAAIKTDNTLWTWGSNTIGVLGGLAAGTGIATDRSSPVQIGTAYSWKQVSAGGGSGSQYMMAVQNNGTLWAIGGYNNSGQFGDGSTTTRSSPVQIGALTQWRQVSAGQAHTMAIQTDGTLWGWGDNTNGELGTPTYYWTAVSSPIQVGSLSTWSTVSPSGGYGIYAIKNDGTLWVWGSQQSAQNSLGLGTTTAITYSSPVQVGSLTNWSKISSSTTGAMAVKTDGTLWGWGNNARGQIGNGSTVFTSSPVQVGTLSTWASVACKNTGAFSPGSTAAIKTDGTLWVWGANESGQHGRGNTTRQSSPVQVGSLTNWAQVDMVYNGIATAPADGIAAAVKTDGTLWTWGAGGGGGLGGLASGAGTTVTRSSPVQVGSLTNWSQVALGHSSTGVGQYFALAVKTDNTLWGWGNNADGSLGNGTTVSVSSPVQIGTLSDWSSISVTSVGNDQQIRAIKTDGTLWAWGDNTLGQFGDGTTVAGQGTSSPVQIGSLTNWSAVSSNYAGMVAVKNDGAAAPVFIGQTTVTAASSSTTINKPTNVIDGDIMLLVIFANSGAINTPSGWTVADNARGDRAVYYKVASSEGANYTISLSSGTSIVGLIVAYRGASFDVTGAFNASSANPSVATAVTVTNNNSIVLDFAAGGASFPLTTTTAGYRLLGASATGPGVGVFYKTGVAAGSSGTVSIVPGGGVINSMLVALSPTAGVATSYGSLWTSGSNSSTAGVLGTSIADDRYYSSPIQIGQLTNWKSVAANFYYTLALKNDNTLWAWGYNGNGNIGDGTTVDKQSPVQVGYLTDWKSLATVTTSTAVNPPAPSGAIKTDGTLWVWGVGTSGVLGTGDTVSRSSPVQVGVQTNWKQVSLSDALSGKAITFNDI